MSNKGRPRNLLEDINTLTELISAEKKRAVDARLENELGRMLRHKQIEKAEFLAGEEFGRLVIKYRRINGLPSDNPKPNQYEPRSPGKPADGTNEEEAREVADLYKAIHEAVVTAWGHKAFQLAYDLCVDGLFIELYNREIMRKALRTIAHKMKL